MTTLGHLEPDLSLALEKGETDYDVVRCDCGHDELAGNVQVVLGATACLGCYEEAKAAEEGDRGTYELHGGYR